MITSQQLYSYMRQEACMCYNCNPPRINPGPAPGVGERNKKNGRRETKMEEKGRTKSFTLLFFSFNKHQKSSVKYFYNKTAKAFRCKCCVHLRLGYCETVSITYVHVHLGISNLPLRSATCTCTVVFDSEKFCP